jgi:hypothetical protein
VQGGREAQRVRGDGPIGQQQVAVVADAHDQVLPCHHPDTEHRQQVGQQVGAG